MKIKTIDINAKEWFNKTNRYNYFTEKIILNYGLKDECTINVNITYGYDNYYIRKAFKILEEHKFLQDIEKYPNKTQETLWQYCKRNKIILRNFIQKGCTKKEIKQFIS